MISVTILILFITIMSTTNASGIKRIVYENAGTVEWRKINAQFIFVQV